MLQITAKKKIKIILALVLLAAGILWLIPTVFVESTVLRTTGYTLTDDSDPEYNIFTVEYTYPFGKEQRTGSFTQRLYKDVTPTVGAQDVCHYYTVPPYPVFLGDAASPVPPLVCILLGILLLFIKKPKFRKNKTE